MPMLHAHGADFAGSAGVMAFEEHLAEYHFEASLNSHVDFGWHWHLVLPMEDHSNSECDGGHHPHVPYGARDSLMVVQSNAPSLHIAPIAVLTWEAPTPALMCMVFQSIEHHPTKFLATYLGSISLGDLLRVARC